MLIERTSTLTGKTRIKEIPVTQQQLDDWISGTLIQRAMPNISANDREFILNGITPEEFDEAFPEEEKLYTLQEVSDLFETYCDDYLLYLLQSGKCSVKGEKSYYSFKDWYINDSAKKKNNPKFL